MAAIKSAFIKSLNTSFIQVKVKYTWASTFKTKLRVLVQLQVSITPFEIKFGFIMHLPWTQPIFIPKATDRSFRGLS